MKIYTRLVGQMTDDGVVWLEEDSYEYEGSVAVCGGGPSDQEKQASAGELLQAQTNSNIANSNNAQQQAIFKAIQPYASSRMNNGLPFFNALTDYSGGTNARAFAPARAQLQQYLNKSPGGPSGFKAQAMGDFEANRARGFDQAMTGNLLTNEQAKQQGAQVLSGQANQLNPLGWSQAAGAAYNPQQYSGMRSAGMGGMIGGLAGGALSAVPF